MCGLKVVGFKVEFRKLYTQVQFKLYTHGSKVQFTIYTGVPWGHKTERRLGEQLRAHGVSGIMPSDPPPTPAKGLRPSGFVLNPGLGSGDADTPSIEDVDGLRS